MAAYPNLPQLHGTQLFAADGTVVDRAVSGKVRMRSYYDNVQLTAQVLHELDGPEKDAIWNHYLAHRRLVFAWTIRAGGTTYNVRYTEPPARLAVPGTDRWSVSVKLVIV